MAKYKLPKIKDMLDAGVHFGHQVKRWNPAMEKYIYSVRKNIHIIDLEITEKLLKEACEFLYEEAAKGKVIIFVGTKRQSKDIIQAEAKKCGALYVVERWVGGTITNFETIRKNLSKLLDLLEGREEGRFSNRTKKERLLIDREILKLEAAYGGIVSLTKTPDVLFIIDPKREKTAVHEANRANIPVVAVADTNADPKGVLHIIPGNDDALKSVDLIVQSVASAIEEGYKEYGKRKDATTVETSVNVPIAKKEDKKEKVKEEKKDISLNSPTEDPSKEGIVQKEKKIKEKVTSKDKLASSKEKVKKVASAKAASADKKKG